MHRAVLHYVIVHFDISLCFLIRPHSHHRSSRQPLNVSTYNELNWIIFYLFFIFWHLPYLCLSDKLANCFIMDSSQLLQFNTDSNNQYLPASNCIINKWLISLSNKCNTVISSSFTNFPTVRYLLQRMRKMRLYLISIQFESNIPPCYLQIYTRNSGQCIDLVPVPAQWIYLFCPHLYICDNGFRYNEKMTGFLSLFVALTFKKFSQWLIISFYSDCH